MNESSERSPSERSSSERSPSERSSSERSPSERRLPACTHPTQAGCLLSDKNITNACAAAVDELTKTRLLADALERENKLLNERLETEKQSVVLLSELNNTRKSETEALRSAVDAKNKTITAKDAVIGKQDELVRELKNKKTSPWKRLGDVLIGVAVFAVLK